MHILDTFTILCAGLMIGNELAVSAFVNPALWRLEESPQAEALSLLARRLGKVMPVWYVLCLVLLVIEALIYRHEAALIPLSIAIAIWIAMIIYTVSALVPINNRIAALAPVALPATWRHDHQQWDKRHRWRILFLTTAMLCLTYGLVSNG